jgi:hypothetical protein
MQRGNELCFGQNHSSLLFLLETILSCLSGLRDSFRLRA